MSFLAAVTDNMYRWLIIPIAKDQLKGLGLSAEEIKAEESLILSLGLGSLILPFVVFAPWSSWLGDRFSKRTTTIWLKVAEVVLVALGIWSIQTAHQGTMFAVLFFLGTQSALLSTAKYGIISELVPRSSLSAANGLVALVTLVAAIVGAGAGMQLGEHAIDGKSLTLAAIVLEAVAVLGVIGSVLIQRVPSANPTLAFPWNPIQYSWRDMKLVISDRPILRVSAPAKACPVFTESCHNGSRFGYCTVVSLILRCQTLSRLSPRRDLKSTTMSSADEKNQSRSSPPIIRS